ncbi:Mediator of RNA polymerase II transcription subunit 17 [Acropora cervicornis]|uniref:Mediator of RNA polymerase II transcription subunit 17 n=1 Tax=Acropora cervicornis TaxID=6130 RepID=A0AAD9QWD3_ACRCE|nr:Mediator of RNA polymerase II transcription subunit 17 [Acropora cervicornis]
MRDTHCLVFKMAARLAVDIAIESLLEQEVEEISRDGQEKYVPKSLTEICVLSDVLNIVHDKKYLVLDPVSQNQATEKPMMSLITKKRSLANASDILLRGAQRMEDAVKERTDHGMGQGSSVRDFHSELMILRRRWRLKRTGTSIMGDLTYRSVGSQFRNPGLFEVTQATKDQDDAEKPSSLERRSLEVTVGSDLEGRGEIRVAIVTAKGQIDTATLRGGYHGNPSMALPLWQRKLESAQSNLFCKELFVQIFPGTDLCITYHTRKNDEEEKPLKVDQDSVPCDQSLVYSLHCLLRKRHHQAHTLQAPRPITAYPSQGRSKRLCLAGPSALTAAEVADDLQGECLLEGVLNISRHKVLLKRVVEVIGRLKSQMAEPCIMCHWSMIGCDTRSLVTIHITSPEIGHVARSSFQLRIGIRRIHVVNNYGLCLDLSIHSQDLEDFILSQVCNHRLSAAKSLAQSLGWHIIHCSRHVGTGPVEPQGHMGGLMVKSPNGAKCIAVRTGPSSGVSILVRRPMVPSGVAPELLGDMNWGSLGGDFQEVHYSKMPGRTFVQKLFLLLAVEMY